MAFSSNRPQARRALLLSLSAATIALGSCQSRAPYRPIAEPGQPDRPTVDGPRHQVALIIPLTGADGGVGSSISNAANLALLDTNTSSIRLTTYDSSAMGAAAAAQRAIANGAQLILGPLLAEDVRALAPVARRAQVPVIAFSNDASVAGDGVYILGITPAQSIDRVVRHARTKGAAGFAALAPTGLYGQRAAQALIDSARAAGGRVAGIERFARTPAAARSAAIALGGRGGFDTLLIADTGRIASSAASAIRPRIRLIGTELWAGDKTLGQLPRLRGALFAAAPDARFTQLVTRYRARFGKTPYRLGSLGYDAALLSVRASRSWPAGRPFPVRTLTDRDGFAGVDGIFRFTRNGIAERALEVRQVTATGSTVVAPAATSFAN